MLGRLGSALVFVAGSVVGGLALAFLIVALRPELIRDGARSAPASLPVVPQPPAPEVPAIERVGAAVPHRLERAREVALDERVAETERAPVVLVDSA